MIWRVDWIMYGKILFIVYKNVLGDILYGLFILFEVIWYHLLVVEEFILSDDFVVMVMVEDDGEMMGLMYCFYFMWGVQFYLESILIIYGLDLLKNFFVLGEIMCC